MPDTRKHRGQHPQDNLLFSPQQIPSLRKAVYEFSWLRSKGYPEKATLKLVGDRYRFKERQRKAIQRAACTDESLKYRQKHYIPSKDLANKIVLIDGYNLLITIESALSGGLVFIGRDGCYRDLASVHGTYRKVVETLPAIQLIGDYLKYLQIEKAIWYFDSPVSNSGRLKTIFYEQATKNQWNWEINLVYNPDKELINSSTGIIVSSDSMVLDNTKGWANLGASLIDTCIDEASLVNMSR